MGKIPFAVVAVCFVVLLSNSIVFGQIKKDDAQILSKEQIDKVFTEPVKNQFNIN